MGTKVMLALVGAALLTGAGVAFVFVLKTDDAALWALWFGGVTLLIGQYSAANVVINGQASRNYRAELAAPPARATP